MFDGRTSNIGLGVVGWDWPRDGFDCVPVPRPNTNAIRGVAYRHGIGVNMLFADGHTERLASPLLGLYGAKGSPAPWNFPLAGGWTNGNNWLAQ